MLRYDNSVLAGHLRQKSPTIIFSIIILFLICRILIWSSNGSDRYKVSCNQSRFEAPVNQNKTLMNETPCQCAFDTFTDGCKVQNLRDMSFIICSHAHPQQIFPNSSILIPNCQPKRNICETFFTSCQLQEHYKSVHACFYSNWTSIKGSDCYKLHTGFWHLIPPWHYWIINNTLTNVTLHGKYISLETYKIWFLHLHQSIN